MAVGAGGQAAGVLTVLGRVGRVEALLEEADLGGFMRVAASGRSWLGIGGLRDGRRSDGIVLGLGRLVFLSLLVGRLRAAADEDIVGIFPAASVRTLVERSMLVPAE